MPKLTWVDDRFSGSEAAIAHGLRVSVFYERITRMPLNEPAWNVYVFGCKLKLRSASKQEAQDRAERCAMAWLKEATGVLGECSEQPSPARA